MNQPSGLQRQNHTTVTSRLQRRPAKQSGAALVVILVLGAAILLSAVTLAYSARTELRIAQNQYRGLQAFYSAEAGISHAFRLLAADPQGFNAILGNSGTGGVLAQVGTGADVSVAGVPYRFRQFGGTGATDGYYVRVEDNVDENPNNPAADADRRVTIIARGRAGEAERVVKGVVGLAGGYCLFATATSGNGIVMNGNTTLVDSYNSAAGSYAATVARAAMVGTNAGVNVVGGGTIAGDVTAAGSINATVTGVKTIDPSFNQQFAPVAACSSYSVISGYTTAGDLTVNAGTNLMFNAGTYCFKDIRFNGNSTLTVAAGPVFIYATGTIDLSGGAIVNNTYQPSNLRLFSSGTSVTLAGGANAYLTVYSPGAPINITGGGSIYGGLVGHTLEFSGGANIHCDENTTTGPPGAGSGLKLVSFH